MSASMLVVVSGPSGVGKTTVCDDLLRRDAFERVITATTRAPRAGEADGVDYVFLTDDEFSRWIDEARFLEWAHVHGARYGSPRVQADEILGRGRHALLNIDVQGAEQIRGVGLPCILVMLLPPSMEELEQRLRDRGSDSEEAIGARLATARAELARSDEFDLKVVNDNSRRATEEIVERLARMRREP